VKIATKWPAFGLLASAAIVGLAIAVWRIREETGYVEIKTVPVAPLTQASIYLNSARLAPIRQGSALLRKQVGTLTLSVDLFGVSRVPVCDIVIRPNRITTVTLSVLERPPRCICRFTRTGDANDRTCIS
jgi:hypothetical protein